MNQPTYNSVPGHKNSSLAEKTWEEFKQFVSVYQWAPDDPSHSPTKEQIAHAIIHRRQKGNCTTYRNGTRFVLKPMHSWALEKAIKKRQKIYYVSSRRFALLYLDLDLHHPW